MRGIIVIGWLISMLWLTVNGPNIKNAWEKSQEKTEKVVTHELVKRPQDLEVVREANTLIGSRAFIMNLEPNDFINMSDLEDSIEVKEVMNFDLPTEEAEKEEPDFLEPINTAISQSHAFNRSQLLIP